MRRSAASPRSGRDGDDASNPMRLRAKKFLASKLSESKVGRAAILRLAGESGVALMNSIKGAITKISGKTTARATKLHIMKLVVKSAVLVQENRLTAADVEPSRASTIELADSLVELLSNPGVVHDVAPIGELITEVSRTLTPALAEKMKDRNASRLTTVAIYLSSDEFLNKFCYDPELRVERATMLVSLRAMMSPFQREMDTVRSYKVDRLVARRDRLRHTMSSTGVEGFLMLENTRQAFQSWVMQTRPDLGRLVPFYMACQDYAKIQNRGLMLSRGERIYRNYLEPRREDTAAGSLLSIPSARVDIRPATIRTLGAAVQAGDMRRDAFAAALEEVVAILNELYVHGFQSSANHSALQSHLENISAKIHVHRSELNHHNSVSVRRAGRGEAKALSPRAAARAPSPAGLRRGASAKGAQHSGEVFAQTVGGDEDWAVTEDGLVLHIEDDADIDDAELVEGDADTVRQLMAIADREAGGESK